MKISVYLTDIHWRTSYFVARALHRTGHKVIGFETQPSVFSKSRYYDTVIPISSQHPDNYSWLVKEAQRLDQHSVIMPLSVSAMAYAIEHLDQQHLTYKVLLPSSKQLQLTADKRKTLELMQEIDIPIPPTCSTSSDAKIEAFADKHMLPVVVKLRLEGHALPEDRFSIVHDRELLPSVVASFHQRQENPLLQAFIDGVGVGISILARQGKMIASFSHRRLRERSPQGGASTYCEPFDSPQLNDYAQRFCEHTGWHGIAMLEFKYVESDHSFVLMEVNPRFWGALPLALHNQVNFPALAIDMLFDRQPDQPVTRSGPTKRLKFTSMDLDGFRLTLAGLSRQQRWAKTIAYYREYLDSSLRFAWDDLSDYQVWFHELKATIKSSMGLWRDVV